MSGSDGLVRRYVLNAWLGTGSVIAAVSQLGEARTLDSRS